MKILWLLLCPLFLSAQVKLPALVRDSMILQRDKPLHLWGWAAAGEKVRIDFRGKHFSTKTGTDGKWTIDLPAQHVGGPYTMQINGIQLRDILIGDVWLCSGQSNMVHQMALHSERYADDIASSQYPEIRQFWTPTGYWKAATPEDVRAFSAVAYFFARHLYRLHRVPIGLIVAAVGGSPVEAWLPAEVINNKIPAAVTGDTVNDKGLTEKWYDTAYVPKHWRPINIPGYWEDQGITDLNGTVWYRREINMTAATTAKLSMGRIIDADVVYLNGQQVGSTAYKHPQRRYQLNLKKGKNLIVIRVSNYTGKGGFVPDKPYYLSMGKDTIDLKGTWLYKVGAVSNYAPPPVVHAPGSYYNTLLRPLDRYTIKGMLWYQGEANTIAPGSYTGLLSALIKNCREQWQQPTLPFLYVQLPNFMEVQYLPSESNWAATREAQRQTLAVPNTGMAVTIDVGEWNDIHPDRKKEVGDRLALLARKMVYKEELVATGPMFEMAQKEANKVVISFTGIGSGLITNDGEIPAQFAIAGEDKKFVWAEAKIEGNTVVVWSDKIAVPKYVRYAWADNPDNPNLSNREGLPASPFEAVIQ